MESASSLPHSQQHVICPFSEVDQTSL